MSHPHRRERVSRVLYHVCTKRIRMRLERLEPLLCVVAQPVEELRQVVMAIRGAALTPVDLRMVGPICHLRHVRLGQPWGQPCQGPGRSRRRKLCGHRGHEGRPLAPVQFLEEPGIEEANAMTSRLWRGSRATPRRGLRSSTTSRPGRSRSTRSSASTSEPPWLQNSRAVLPQLGGESKAAAP